MILAPLKTLSSNDVWIADSFLLDVMLVNGNGQSSGRPTLTLIVDAYSGCIAGFHLTLERLKAHCFISALRHSILQKNYCHGHEIVHNWGVYGVPNQLIIDAQKISERQVFLNFLKKLGIRLAVAEPFATYRNKTEKISLQLQKHLTRLSVLPISSDPIINSDSSRNSYLTLQQLEDILIKYICNCYNQSYAHGVEPITLSQKWLSGFNGTLPELVENC